MVDDTRAIGIRIPTSLYRNLKKIAHEKEISLTAVAIEAFKQYVGNCISGLCPHCHTQNNPDAKYCQQCSTPLTEEARTSLIEASKIAEKSEIYEEIRKMIREELGLPEER